MTHKDRIAIEYRRTDSLVPYENNPRINDESVPVVAQSIDDFGFLVPCVITPEGVLITGHTRVRAAKELGMEEVPCIVARDLDDARAKMYRLADNKTQELSGWDFPKLAEELEELRLDFEIEDYGFSPLDLGEDVPPAPGDAIEVEEVPEVPQGEIVRQEASQPIATGDRVILGSVTLVCGHAGLREVQDEASARHRVTFWEPDPYELLALLRGWVGDGGKAPVLMRDGEEVPLDLDTDIY